MTNGSYTIAINVNSKSDKSGIQSASKELDGFGSKLNSTLDIISKSGAAAVAAGAVFKKAFELGQEGANINQLTQSFDLLNEQVLHTPNLLNDMQVAAKGTVSDLTLMEGVLKLTAGTSQELSQQFAASSPQLIEIAKAAQKLNPTLGDTSFLYESISTGIKRQSPLILDNLGIVVKVGEANEKYAASLGKTVAELTAEEKQMALLNATLESGSRLIEQVGGDTASAADSYAILNVKIEESTSKLKQWLGDGLIPVIKVVNGEYSNTIDALIAQQKEMAASLDDPVLQLQALAEQYENTSSGLTQFTGASKSYHIEAAQVVAANIDLTKSGDDLIENIEEVLGVEAELNQGRIQLANGLGFYISELRTLQNQQAINIAQEIEAINAESLYAEKVDITGNRLADFTATTSDADDELSAFTETMNEADAEATDYSASLSTANEQLGNLNETLPANVTSLASHYINLQLARDGVGTYADGLAVANEKASEGTGLIASINEELARLGESRSFNLDIGVTGLEKLQAAVAAAAGFNSNDAPDPYSANGDVPANPYDNVTGEGIDSGAASPPPTPPPTNDNGDGLFAVRGGQGAGVVIQSMTLNVVAQGGRVPQNEVQRVAGEVLEIIGNGG